MTPSLSEVNTATAGKRGLKQNLSVILSTPVKELPTKIRIPCLFGESGKIVRHIHSAALPRDEEKHAVTIHYPTMDCTYLEMRYAYFLSDPEDPSNSLGNIGNAGMYAGDSRN